MVHADYSNFGSESDKDLLLESVVESYKALADGQDNWVCNLSNCASLLWHCYSQISNGTVNWTGFYVLDEKNNSQLILGPFQGKVACQLIPFGKGVCGAAAESRQTQLVPDVEKFPGHIACDGDTKSEIVVPIIQNEKIIGVIDLDCTQLEMFDESDKKWLEILASEISKSCNFPF